MFSSQPKHVAHLPRFVPGITPPEPLNMRYVVKWMKENLLSEREEMFGEGDGVYASNLRSATGLGLTSEI